MKRFFRIVLVLLLPTSALCQVSTIEGIVYLRETGAPVAAADVYILEADQHEKTDENGTFRFAEIPAGMYTLNVTHSAISQPIELSIEVRPGDTTEIKIYLDSLFKLETIVVEEKRLPSTVSRKNIRGNELIRIPGTANDALRGLTTLPGIGIPNDYLGILYIRGSEPGSTLYYLDRTPLGYPFHWGGLLSTVSSEIIEEIDIYAGGYGAEFGLDAHTVLDIHTRRNLQERIRGKFNLNILYSQGLLEGRIGDKGYISVAGRRSYLDLILGSIVENQTDIDQQFPYFSDYQFKLDYSLTNKHHLTFNAFAATDHFRLELEERRKPEEPYSFAHFNNGFTGQGIHLRSDFTKNLTSHFSLTRSYNFLNIDFKAVVKEIFVVGADGKDEFVSADFFLYDLRTRVPLYMLREDVSYKVTPKLQFEPGFLLAVSPVTNFVQGRFLGDQRAIDYTIGDVQGEALFGSTAEATHDEFSNQFLRAEGYLQGRYDPTSFLSLALGVRLDYLNVIEQISLQPRGSVSIKLSNYSYIRFAYGHYEQSPKPYQLLSENANLMLESNLARHYIMELEHELSPMTEFKFATYYKDIQKLVTRHPVSNYLNQGVGYIAGAEAFLKHSISDKFFGWVSYAYTHAERRDNPGVAYQPYVFDNTHIISLVGNYSFTPKFEIGAKWQYLSGTAEAPVSSVALVQDPITSGMNPLLASPDEGVTVELTPYNKLDFRISHKWNIRGWQIGGFLDILNVYNQKNTMKLRVEDVSVNVSTEVRSGSLDDDHAVSVQTSDETMEHQREEIDISQFPRLIYFGLTLEF